ncbi:unnamed protein product [Closterium sp. Naga37s-1]|nr:unnamed protein product [Closterium sp. Naga37s-1]
MAASWPTSQGHPLFLYLTSLFLTPTLSRPPPTSSSPHFQCALLAGQVQPKWQPRGPQVKRAHLCSQAKFSLVAHRPRSFPPPPTSFSYPHFPLSSPAFPPRLLPPSPLPSLPCSQAKFSPDGTLVANRPNSPPASPTPFTYPRSHPPFPSPSTPSPFSACPARRPSSARMGPSWLSHMLGDECHLPCSQAKFSPDGTLVAVAAAGGGVRLIHVPSGEQRLHMPLEGVQALAFSPKGSYLQVFQRPSAPAGGGQAEPNLTVRRVSDGEVVWRQMQKTFNSAAWPSMQFSADESVACRPVNGEVQLFTGADLAAGVAARLKVPGMTSAQLAPSPPSHIAVFAPEAKGAPASVRIFTRDSAAPSSSSSAASAPPAPIARRSFFKCSAVRLVWNVGTTAVLVWTHSDVDKTNQSYYGESGLHFLAADGSFEGAVPLSKEGPIHDVQWSPNGKDFVVVHGFMPAKATLFDSRCKPLFDFGSGPRNLVRWSPHSRCEYVAGCVIEQRVGGRGELDSGILWGEHVTAVTPLTSCFDFKSGLRRPDSLELPRWM